MYCILDLNYTILYFTVFHRVLQMDAEEILHEFIYIDEAGFHLTKARRRGTNIIGHRAIINVPGQLVVRKNQQKLEQSRVVISDTFLATTREHAT